MDLLNQVEEIARIGHWWLDLATDRFIFSDQMYVILNLDRDTFDHSRKSVRKLIFPEDLNEIIKLRDMMAVGGKDVLELYHRVIRPDGEIRHFKLYVRNIFDDSRKVVKIFGTSMDITKQKLLEKENKNLQQQFAQAQKMEAIGKLAGGIAHDFNNMLSVILGNAELAITHSSPTDPNSGYIKEIIEATIRAANLTRQILAFARKQTIAPKVLNLNYIIGEMVTMLKRLVSEDIDLFWKPCDNIWLVKIDPAQVDQILVNLAVNARDAISGVGKLTIETNNVEFDKAYCAKFIKFVPGQYTMIAVSDDGCGMDRETQDLIFEPFFTTKDKNIGSGLGLSTVYGIVRQNEGFINVYSEPGKGASFKIYLPRYKGQAEVEKTFFNYKPESLIMGDETILIVEDDPSLLKMTVIMLEELGYTVLAAENPSKALELAKRNTDRIHLLLTDVVMPEMNGKELVEQFLTLNMKFKHIFMSGYTANVIAHRGILNEGVHLIQKPFSKKELGKKIRRALGN